MPLNASNTKNVHRRLFGPGVKVRLYKREDDQRQGVVRTHVLFGVHKSRIQKTGEPIQGEMSVDHHCIWHIPKVQLDRVGVNYLNAADRIEELQGPGAVRGADAKGRFWQPEATTPIDVKLFENFVDLYCLRIDPPNTPKAQ